MRPAGRPCWRCGGSLLVDQVYYTSCLQCGYVPSRWSAERLAAERKKGRNARRGARHGAFVL